MACPQHSSTTCITLLHVGNVWNAGPVRVSCPECCRAFSSRQEPFCRGTHNTKVLEGTHELGNVPVEERGIQHTFFNTHFTKRTNWIELGPPFSRLRSCPPEAQGLGRGMLPPTGPSRRLATPLFEPQTGPPAVERNCTRCKTRNQLGFSEGAQAKVRNALRGKQPRNENEYECFGYFGRSEGPSSGALSEITTKKIVQRQVVVFITNHTHSRP